MVRQTVPMHILVGTFSGFDRFGSLFTQCKVYSVFPSSLLSYTIDKILASKFHLILYFNNN